jgi:hypothetical protein
MKGTRILVSSPTRGVYEDIIVHGTPKPGTCMEIVPATEPIGNVFEYAVYGTQAASGDKFVTADGNRKAVAILLEKDQEGKTYNDAYVDGDRGRIYWPAMGEQFNMLVENQSGTGDSFAIGDEMMIDDGTGKLLAVSSPEAAPFTILETLAALTADTWAWCRFNGEAGA